MEASTKVEGGKFVQLKVEDGEVTLAGDFFVYPEEAVTDLEAIVAEHLDDPAAVRTAIRDHVEDRDVELLGVTPDAIADLAAEVAE